MNGASEAFAIAAAFFFICHEPRKIGLNRFQSLNVPGRQRLPVLFPKLLHTALFLWGPTGHWIIGADRICGPRWRSVTHVR
jgi:hypothetical protein